MYVYIRSEPGLYTVGFYDPQGTWHPDSDHTRHEEAAGRVHWLNGGNGAGKPAGDPEVAKLRELLDHYSDWLSSRAGSATDGAKHGYESALEEFEAWFAFTD